ncbi:hypothetical protein [Lignipirellula cremea]|nr:hypothetical protein [Lignipirellula cremea]
MPVVNLLSDNASYLPFDDVLTRLQGNFEYVELDYKTGRKETLALLDKLIQLDAPQESIDRTAAAADQAVLITAWDGERKPENGIQFVWEPDSMLTVQHPPKARRYVTRAGRALGYKLEEW